MNDSKVYWATEEADKLVDSLDEKTKLYYKELRSGIYWQRVLRNLAYYHGLYYADSGDSIDMELKSMGKHGEYVGIAANHLRNFMQHLLTIITRNRLAISPRATNTDTKSLEQTKLARGLLDYYFRERSTEGICRQAVELSLIFGPGFVQTLWNQSAGRWVEEENRFEGDIEQCALTPADVIYDLSLRDFKQASWVITKSYVSRWDLAERYPEKRDEILAYEESAEEKCDLYRGTVDLGKEDRVPLYRFFHKKTDAIKVGRYCEYIPGAYLLDEVMRYREIPVRRVAPAEWLLTTLGFTPAFDLQGLQEMLNSTLSAIATAVAAYGVQDVWIPEGSEKVRQQVLEGGLRVLISAQMPQALSLLKIPGEVMKFPDILNSHMERISGINSVVRGDPDASLKSGEALKVIESKAVQFASGLEESYNRMVEDVGTDMIRILHDFSPTTRIVSILGEANEPMRREFSSEDLADIDRVVVEVSNPLSKTLAGKLAMVKDLRDMGELVSKEQYKDVLQTGNIDTLFQGDNAQLTTIRQENDLLRKGKMVPSPEATDNGVLSIREHASVFSTMEARLDPAIVSAVRSHIMQHYQLLLDPNVQRMQEALGYPIPQTFLLPPAPLGMPPPPGAELPPDQGGGQTGGGEVIQIPQAQAPPEPQIQGA